MVIFQFYYKIVFKPRPLYIYMDCDNIIGNKEQHLPGYIYMSNASK